MALLMSGDSDLSPAVRRVREIFPAIRVRIVGPLGRSFSMDLVNSAGGIHTARRMKRRHVERTLFGATVRDAAGTVVATRPRKYDVPT